MNQNPDKVLFLDIDGVLCICDDKEWDCFGDFFNKECVRNLALIIEQTNAKIVISSTWRIKGLYFMQKMWEKRQLAGEILGITPNFQTYTQETRIQEIDYFINENNITKYAILDDDFVVDRKEFVRTITEVGLTQEIAKKVIEILK